MNKNENNDAAKKVLVGAGIVTGAILAAYLLATSKDKEKASIEVKDWMTEMQKEIAQRVEEVQHLTEEKYDQIIDEVKPKYEKLKDVSAAELSSFSDEMKSHWKNVSNAVNK